ncbi:MAG: hypothetical protein ACTSQI_19450 [Candidatus Helarchaeota archaeon]
MTMKSRKKMNIEEANLIDKWIYILLYANNHEAIRGRIRFTKEFFLIAKKLVPELFKVSEFFGYHFGPYSTRMGVRINKLKAQRKVKAEMTNQDWEYSLTEDGLEIAKELINELSEDLIQKVIKIKADNKKRSLKSLLKEIYLEYPEYAQRSIIYHDVTKEEVDLEKLPPVDDGPGFVAAISSEKKEISLKNNAARSFLDLINE